MDRRIRGRTMKNDSTEKSLEKDDFWQILENELLEVSGEIRSLQEKTGGMVKRRPWYRRIFK
jgi:hypothetical protein